MSTTTESVTLESFASSAVSDDGGASEITINKPTGLEEGDLMVACVFAAGSGNVVVLSSPAGWTTQEELREEGGTDISAGLFYKEADSGDVAASDFTFNSNNAYDVEGGVILRLSSWSAVDTSSSDTALTTSGITPNTSDSFLILFGIAHEASTSQSFSFSSYSLTNDDPTWTEQYDNSGSGDGDDDAGLAFATAERSERTATGDASLSLSGTADSTITILLSISPFINGTVTDSGQDVEIFSFPIINMEDIEVTQTAPTVNGLDTTVWTNQSRSSTTWTNQNKS